MKNNYKFPYKWYLKDGYPSKDIDNHKLKVFSTFACGGGSSFGYKLAGYDVIGANDIDVKMSEVYKENHNPELYYLCDIRDLNKKIINKEVDKRLFDLNILDGSPPCSNFSIAGNREKDWGKKKKFREGQVDQVLDDLFFHFIETTRLLQPKVVIAENVKGLIQGNAKGYVKEIMKMFDLAGYNMQLFLLNAASMGVPQKRQRVFFIGYRKNLKFDKLKLEFNEKSILFKEISDLSDKATITHLKSSRIWEKTPQGKDLSYSLKENKYFTSRRLSTRKVSPTIISGEGSMLWHPTIKRILNRGELCKIGSFPQDYNFLDNKVKYIIGMSVPPIMTAQISYKIYEQWLKR